MCHVVFVTLYDCWVDLSSLRRLNQFLFTFSFFFWVRPRASDGVRYLFVPFPSFCLALPQLIWVPHTSSPGNFSLPHHISGPPAHVHSMFHSVFASLFTLLVWADAARCAALCAWLLLPSGHTLTSSILSLADFFHPPLLPSPNHVFPGRMVQRWPRKTRSTDPLQLGGRLVGESARRG